MPVITKAAAEEILAKDYPSITDGQKVTLELGAKPDNKKDGDIDEEKFRSIATRMVQENERAALIESKAKEIYMKGVALEYMVETCQKRHVGDIIPTETFIFSYASTRVRSGNGIHVTMKGSKASGKTDCAKTVLLIIPTRDTLPPGSFSDKSLFYMSIGENPILHQGVILHVDDQTPTVVWEELNKARQSDFWAEFHHYSVKKDLSGSNNLHIPAACPSWVTIVTDVSDEQSQSRAIIIKADETKEQREAVFKLGAEKAKHPKRLIQDTQDIDICRAIWDLMPGESFVSIPFSDRIRYDLSDDTANRTKDIFFTLIQCVAYMRAPIRDVDEDGCIVATEEDFRVAEEIMNQSLDIRLIDLTETQKLLLAFLYDTAKKRQELREADLKEKQKQRNKDIQEHTYGKPVPEEPIPYQSEFFDMKDMLKPFCTNLGRTLSDSMWRYIIEGRDRSSERKGANAHDPGLDTVPGIQIKSQLKNGIKHTILEFDAELYDLMKEDLKNGVHHFYLAPEPSGAEDNSQQPTENPAITS